MSFLRDPYTYITTCYIIAIDWIATHINLATSALVGLGGLITIIMGIMHRRKKYRLEIRIKEAELRRIERN